MNILCGVAYDGSEFSGWQIQPEKITVQSVIEEVLTKLYGIKIKITGAGRTDSGVHALRNYFNFKILENKIPADKLVYVLNNFLPHSIRILSAKEVEEDFNSRRNFMRRIYEYRIVIGEVSPFFRNYRLFLKKKLDVDKMNQAIKLLIGTYDFSGFKAADCKSKTQTRTVYNSSVSQSDFFHYFVPHSFEFCVSQPGFEPACPNQDFSEVIIHIEANAFLKNMVRIITGTLIDIGYSKKKPEIINEILESKERRIAGKTVSPAGLYLIDAIPDFSR